MNLFTIIIASIFALSVNATSLQKDDNPLSSAKENAYLVKDQMRAMHFCNWVDDIIATNHTNLLFAKDQYGKYFHEEMNVWCNLDDKISAVNAYKKEHRL